MIEVRYNELLECPPSPLSKFSRLFVRSNRPIDTGSFVYNRVTDTIEYCFEVVYKDATFVPAYIKAYPLDFTDDDVIDSPIDYTPASHYYSLVRMNYNNN